MRHFQTHLICDREREMHIKSQFASLACIDCSREALTGLFFAFVLKKLKKKQDLKTKLGMTRGPALLRRKQNHNVLKPNRLSYYNFGQRPDAILCFFVWK